MGYIQMGYIFALCPIILVLFDVGLYSRSFYEQKIVYIWSGDNFDVFCVFVGKATHNIYVKYGANC